MPPTPPSLLSPSFTDENPLPPLPPIHDDDVRTKIFTHRSFYARPLHVFEDCPDDPSPDNEKYEHLGDIVLGLVVTNLLMDTYPNLRVGPSTQIRALIVGNPTLADISRRYQLPAQLRLHPAQAITLTASTHVQADVFESYVGGLYLDQGLSAVERWLKVLLKPYATEAYIRVRTQHGLPPLPPSPPPTPSTSASSASDDSSSNPDTTSSKPTSEESRNSTGPTPTRAHRNTHRHPHASGTPTTTGHLALFNQHIQKGGCGIEWVYDDSVSKGATTTPIWTVRVEVDGKVLGHGKGGTKKAARNEAAKQGLVHLGIEV